MRTNDAKVILCVDDEATGLLIRKKILESRGYLVFSAENGYDGLSIFLEEPVDLVVLDYMMPGMNGDVVAEKMKSISPSTPILMLSAYVDLPRQALTFVDRCLTKGEGPAALLLAIAELLSDSVPESSATPAA